MATFLPLFFTVALISLALSFFVMLVFATFDGITIPRIKARYQGFMSQSPSEKVRLAYHVPFAILMGGLVGLALVAFFPGVLGHPVIVIPVFALTAAMVALTLG